MITYKTEDEVPQYSVTIAKLTVEPTLPDALFRFTPPAGATRVEVVGVQQPLPGDETKAQENKQ